MMTRNFPVVTTGAGRGELVVTVTTGRGTSVPINNQVMTYGNQISYTPKESGMYIVNATFGGVNIAGRIIVFRSFSGCFVLKREF